ncbi:MAG: FMN-binding protein [Treponema sp.]|jgi:electron transport complex protein RnfG|nr:FMN-binding protein [Treponema sp.]
MKDMFKLGSVLALYATVACVGLAWVYVLTTPIIAQRQQTDLENSLKELFPEADSFNSEELIVMPNPQVSLRSMYSATKNGTVIGLALRASGSSYGGPIVVLVGISTQATVSRVKILEHSDTPGLGANAASSKYYIDKPTKTTFSGQFSGKSVQDPFTVHEDIVAITASTITSRAVTSIVKTCGEAAISWFSEHTL